MEYRIAKGWRIFVVIICAAFLIGGLVLLFKAFIDAKAVLAIPALILIPLGAWMCLDTLKTRLVIDECELTLQRAFSSRSLLLKEIEGFRKGEKDTLFLIPKGGSSKPLQLSNYSYWENKEELMQWLAAKYPDVDAVQFEAETHAILENEQFGLTQTDREASLTKAGQIAKWANIAAIGLIVWSFFYPRPYEGILLLLLVIPWVSLGIIGYFKGLMRFNTKKGSPYPSIDLLIYFSIAALLLRALLDYKLYAYQMIWPPVFILAALLTAAGLAICRTALAAQNKGQSAWIVIFIFASIYSYGAIIVTNCYYDRSTSREFRVEVKGKHITSGKTTTYYLLLDPWGRFTEEEDVSVSKRVYEKAQMGDPVYVFLKKGKWNIPWYWVTD